MRHQDRPRVRHQDQPRVRHQDPRHQDRPRVRHQDRPRVRRRVEEAELDHRPAVRRHQHQQPVRRPVEEAGRGLQPDGGRGRWSAAEERHGRGRMYRLEKTENNRQQRRKVNSQSNIPPNENGTNLNESHHFFFVQLSGG